MNSFQKRLGLSIALVGTAIIALVIGLNLNSQAVPATQNTPSFMMTLDPTVIANLTSIPQSTPLSDEEAEQFLNFVEQIESCDDYSDERRSQMLQHIEWLINPSTIPSEMLIALGTNIDAGLIFGMASFTSIEWRLLERPADSCLIDIGRDINILLEAVGREPITIYDE